MPKKPSAIIVSEHVARTRLASLLRRASQEKARFVITRTGKPAAVLLGIRDFDDILEELDPEFQKSLKFAAKEFREGKAVSLRDYLGERPAERRLG